MNIKDIVGIFTIGTLALASFKPVNLVKAETQQPVSSQQQSHSPTSTGNVLQKRIKIDLEVATPSDIKVRQGDRVQAGQVIADRDTERSQLTAEKQQTELAIKKVKEMIEPPLPQLRQVPGIVPLPPPNYSAELAEISKAQVKLDQAKRGYNLYQEANPQSLVQHAAVDLAATNVQSVSESVKSQEEKLAEVSTLTELPPDVLVHEQKILEHKKLELDKSSSELKLKDAEVRAGELTQKEHSLELADRISEAETELNLAVAKLQAAKNHRQQQEYENSITLAKHIQEQNITAEEYAKQQRDIAENQRKQQIDVAQLQARLSDINQKLSQLSTVKSPFGGVIKRVKTVGQQDNRIKVEVILATVDGDSFVSTTGGSTTKSN